MAKVDNQPKTLTEFNIRYKELLGKIFRDFLVLGPAIIAQNKFFVYAANHPEISHTPGHILGFISMAFFADVAKNGFRLVRLKKPSSHPPSSSRH